MGQRMRFVVAPVVWAGVMVIGSVVCAQDAPPADQEQGWRYSGDLGLPALDGEKSAFVAALELGYTGETFGLGGFFDLASYSFVTDEIFSLNDRLEYGIDAFYKVASFGDIDVKVRLDLGGLDYSTTYQVNSDNSDEVNEDNFDTFEPSFDDSESSESSSIARSAIYLTVNNPRKSQIWYELYAGIGYQFEFYSQTSFQASGGGEGDFMVDDSALDTESDSSLFLVGAKAGYRFLPLLLELRFEGVLKSYTISRSTFLFEFSLDNTEEFDEPGEPFGDKIEEFAGIDLNTRLFLDIPFLELFTLKPNIFVGLDYYSISGASMDTTTIVPLAGLGFIN